MKQLLQLLCVFTTAAAIWLGVMENVLRHSGYAERSVIAASIALQSLATLLYFRLRERSGLRNLVVLGAVAIAVLGGSALGRILQSPHFEGFVLIIAAALLLQAGLTLATLLPGQHKESAA